MRINRIVNIKGWQERRKYQVGYGTRDKVVLKQSKMGKVYFIAKTYENNIGELRSEVCASTIGRLYNFPVQKTWLCEIPNHAKLKLKHKLGVLIQLDVRRQRYTKRNQFRENLIHGLALISSVDKNFGKASLAERRRLYTLDIVIKALRNYTKNKPLAKSLWDDFFKLMCFDALIGGTDRHYNNWGILEKADDESFLRLSPAFDNGVSLLWNMDIIRQQFVRDLFTRGYEKKAKSCLRKSNRDKYTLYEILEELYSIPEYKNSTIVENIISDLNNVGDGFLSNSLTRNIPKNTVFQTNTTELNLLAEYVRIRKELLLNKLYSLRK